MNRTQMNITGTILIALIGFTGISILITYPEYHSLITWITTICMCITVVILVIKRESAHEG